MGSVVSMRQERKTVGRNHVEDRLLQKEARYFAQIVHGKLQDLTNGSEKPLLGRDCSE